MSSLLSRRRVGRAAVATVAVVSASLALLPASPANADPTGTVSTGTATWGISTYLNLNAGGRPNPYPAGYTAPATYDATTKVSTWGTATGTVKQDGSATIALKGSSVNWANGTSGHWLRFTDLEATLDTAGNGTVTALVSYGVSASPAAFDDTTVQRAATRIDIVDLAGNTAADRAVTATSAGWTGLDGAWDSDLLTFLQGDTTPDPDIPAFAYASTIVNDGAKPERAPSPFAFSLSTVAPHATATVTAADKTTGLTVKVDGTGFRGDSLPGDAGVYVGLAPSGGLPDVSTMDALNNFAAASYVPGAIATGAFSSTLTAAPAKLDKTKNYSIYTWQSHTHSNTSQDTETPVTIDWAALGLGTSPPPAITKSTPSVAADFVKKPVANRKARLAISVAGSGATTPSGTVTVTLQKKGAKKAKTLTAALAGGSAKVKLPKLAAGRWTVTVAYAGDSAFNTAVTAMRLKVKPGKK